jgi:hypothetical protein
MNKSGTGWGVCAGRIDSKSKKKLVNTCNPYFKKPTCQSENLMY